MTSRLEMFSGFEEVTMLIVELLRCDEQPSDGSLLCLETSVSDADHSVVSSTQRQFGTSRADPRLLLWCGFKKTTQGCANVLIEFATGRRSPSYVEAESVVVEPLSGGYHGCARDGGKQRCQNRK